MIREWQKYKEKKEVLGWLTAEKRKKKRLKDLGSLKAHMKNSPEGNNQRCLPSQSNKSKQIRAWGL